MKYLVFGVLALACATTAVCAQQQTTSSKPIPRAVAVQAAPATAVAATATTTGSSDTAPAVPVRPGDTLEIRISNVPAEDMQQWDGAYTVDESGMINLPFIGMLKASGAPSSQLQIAIQNKLISGGIYTNPTITVNPPAGMRFISVGGAVRSPGRVQYTSDLTLMTTINAAQGKSDFAGDEIRLIRDGKIIKYSFKKLEKDPSKDPQIQPGDQIVVKESPW